jgi:hypothetical protein
LLFFVVSFFLLNKLSGFGGGGGPPGGVFPCFILVVSAFLFAVESFLCFLKGLIFLKSSSGGGGGFGGPGGGGDCANTCEEAQSSPIVSGKTSRRVSLALRPAFFLFIAINVINREFLNRYINGCVG